MDWLVPKSASPKTGQTKNFFLPLQGLQLGKIKPITQISNFSQPLSDGLGLFRTPSTKWL